ncbi:hypothetical protein NONI108955_11175 [Nocardia ninae]
MLATILHISLIMCAVAWTATAAAFIALLWKVR